MTHPVADAQKVILSLLAGPVVIALLAFGLVGSLAYCAGSRNAKQDVKVQALRDTVRITDSVEVVRWDTVRVKAKERAAAKAVSDSLDKTVTLRSDSTVVIRDTVREAPPELIADVRGLRVTVAKDSAVILSLYQHDTTQEWRIATMKRLLAAQAPPRCGRKCGVTLGVIGTLALLKLAR